MFESFTSVVGPGETFAERESGALKWGLIPEEFFLEVGGRAFMGGRYRAFDRGRVLHYSTVFQRLFPNFGSEFLVFGATWNGTLLLVAPDMVHGFESLPMNAFETDLDLVAFHADFARPEVSEDLTGFLVPEWAAQGRSPRDVGVDQSISLKVPHELGGKFEKDNLEVCDLEVHVDMVLQFHSLVEDA